MLQSENRLILQGSFELPEARRQSSSHLRLQQRRCLGLPGKSLSKPLHVLTGLCLQGINMNYL